MKTKKEAEVRRKLNKRSDKEGRPTGHGGRGKRGTLFGAPTGESREETAKKESTGGVSGQGENIRSLKSQRLMKGRSLEAESGRKRG